MRSKLEAKVEVEEILPDDLCTALFTDLVLVVVSSLRY